jgi:hypothetical protein
MIDSSGNDISGEEEGIIIGERENELRRENSLSRSTISILLLLPIDLMKLILIINLIVDLISTHIRIIPTGASGSLSMSYNTYLSDLRIGLACSIAKLPKGEFHFEHVRRVRSLRCPCTFPSMAITDCLSTHRK